MHTAQVQQTTVATTVVTTSTYFSDENHVNRVKNALQQAVNNVPLSLHTATSAESPELSSIGMKKRKLDQETDVTTATSKYVVKNRFKHTKPVLSGQSIQQLFSGGLGMISENYEKLQTDDIPTSSNNSPVMSCSPSIQASSSMKTTLEERILLQNVTAAQNSKLLCPLCKTFNTQGIANNLFRCLSCEKQFMPVHMVANPSATTPSKLASFYGKPHSVMNAVQGNKRQCENNKPTKVAKKQKQTEMIDLVSSDDEEKDKEKSEHESNSTTIATRSGSPSPHSVTTTVASQLPNEYKFVCNKAMFGELYGHAIAPTAITKNRIFLSLECTIVRDNTANSEKYTLSVGQKDVQHVYVHFGRVPSFVAIETATRFSEVACERIGKDVLVPSSDIPQKRYIILALARSFQNDAEAAVELQQLLHCVSSWARITLLSHVEASQLIDQAKLDVCQKELNYGKVFGPVETLLLYPIPPKAVGGRIPITNEDVACLADGIYLNDIIIDFYLKYIFEKLLTDEQKSKTYIFNSYFYKRLSQKQGSKPTASHMHSQVKKWTRNVDIFEKDFIVIPINEHCHWYLTIICFPGKTGSDWQCADESDVDEEIDEPPKELTITTDTTPNPPVTPVSNQTASQPTPIPSPKPIASQDSQTHSETSKAPAKFDHILQSYEMERHIRPCILIFDSLVGSGHSSVFTNLRNYVAQEWLHRKPDHAPLVFDKKTIKGSYPKIPRQNNDCDCGIFLLQYVESFFRTPFQSFRFPIHLEKWFTLETAARKRDEIKELISALTIEYRSVSEEAE